MTDPQDEFLPLWAKKKASDIKWPDFSASLDCMLEWHEWPSPFTRGEYSMPPPAYIAERDALRAELATANVRLEHTESACRAAEEEVSELRAELAALRDPVQKVPKVWREALRKLAFMARTSGGTPGPDTGLMAACDEAESLLKLPYLYAAPTAQTVQAAPVSAEDARDAMRYRWLRDSHPADDALWVAMGKPYSPPGVSSWRHEALDAAIDAALAAKGAA
jgi:hypothetical protein